MDLMAHNHSINSPFLQSACESLLDMNSTLFSFCLEKSDGFLSHFSPTYNSTFKAIPIIYFPVGIKLLLQEKLVSNRDLLISPGLIFIGRKQARSEVYPRTKLDFSPLRVSSYLTSK